ncbi:MAG: O-acetyl-ADP-ribose deacetylase [Actinobacteria bacterium]|nr:O-acetyl-ADP-ribose deacetylase [Actinomycetota bacterium]
MEIKVGKSKLSIIKGDITEQKTDAIVNAANQQLAPGGGVAGAIHRAAGPALWEECKRLGGCKTGQAQITKGYSLYARFVIHTVGPVFNNTEKNKTDLADSYRNSLEIAKNHGIKSISFPSISTGIFGYPVGQAAEIAISTITKFLKQNQEIELVQIVLFDDSSYNIFALEAEKYQ